MTTKKYSFSKEERLYLEKEISALFASGKRFSDNSFSVVWCLTENDTPKNPQILISVPKRNFKNATDRNYIKRRIKEAYRLHKYILLNLLEEQNISLFIGFIYRDSRKKSFRQIEENILHSLEIVASKVARVIDENDR